MSDFRFDLTAGLLKNIKNISQLIENGYSPKLNIIFDIDHTLVFAFDKMYCPSLLGSKNVHLLKICTILKIYWF